MTDLQKYEMINQANDIESLQKAILSLADEDGNIQGRTREFPADVMADRVNAVVLHDAPANLLTREFGIRQQALYLTEYRLY